MNGLLNIPMNISPNDPLPIFFPNLNRPPTLISVPDILTIIIPSYFLCIRFYHLIKSILKY